MLRREVGPGGSDARGLVEPCLMPEEQNGSPEAAPARMAFRMLRARNDTPVAASARRPAPTRQDYGSALDSAESQT